jgi:hypothetical protein
LVKLIDTEIDAKTYHWSEQHSYSYKTQNIFPKRSGISRNTVLECPYGQTRVYEAIEHF